MLTLLTAFSNIGRNPLYWLIVLLIGLTMEGIALYYQYGLGYGPCVLCIHIRIWIMAFILLAIVGLIGSRNRQVSKALHLLSLITAIGLAERSWLTFAIERNLIDGSCTMGSGLPSWFALDQWLPSVFEPWELCGWTPDLLFGITMAEGLLLFSAAAIIITLLNTIASFRKQD